MENVQSCLFPTDKLLEATPDDPFKICLVGVDAESLASKLISNLHRVEKIKIQVLKPSGFERESLDSLVKQNCSGDNSPDLLVVLRKSKGVFGFPHDLEWGNLSFIGSEECGFITTILVMLDGNPWTVARGKGGELLDETTFENFSSWLSHWLQEGDKKKDMISRLEESERERARLLSISKNREMELAGEMSDVRSLLPSERKKTSLWRSAAILLLLGLFVQTSAVIGSLWFFDEAEPFIRSISMSIRGEQTKTNEEEKSDQKGTDKTTSEKTKQEDVSLKENDVHILKFGETSSYAGKEIPAVALSISSKVSEESHP